MGGRILEAAMSVSRSVWIYCDVYGCQWHSAPRFDPPNETVVLARADAR